MSELLESYNVLRGTLLRTLIYTIGHFIIAASCVMYFTGADFLTSMTDAIVEPILNGVWYFVLDRVWIDKKLKGNESNIRV